MRESEFIRRVAEAESVIRYTFRLEIPEAEQRLKGDLVACSLDQAYRMTESLFSNYWKNRPFHINDKRKEPFEVKRRELLSDAAVPELYCMVRKIIGEENTMTVYAAGEYAFFDAKAFDMGLEADDILSNFVTGMDDLFNRRKIALVSQNLFEDGYYANAAEDAFVEINDRVKKLFMKVNPTALKVPDGYTAMNMVFSDNAPLVEFCDRSTETGSNIQKGYMQMLAGAMSALRNPKAHANITITKI